MDENSGKRTDLPKTIGPIEVEWNPLDCEISLNKVGDYEVGEEGEAALKARCTRCWGEVEGRRNHTTHVPDAIRCRVCGITLEGDNAKEEYEQMQKEDSSNVLNNAFGLKFKYRDEATFTRKWFPHMERLSEAELLQRFQNLPPNEDKEGWLTRSRFPAGSAGFLFLQARVLMSGVERLPRELSVVRLPETDFRDDGSARVYLSKEELGEHSKTSEYELTKRLGSTMTVAMMSAFACELAMKAIQLTVMDEARKTHDLWRLYRDLPPDSKHRIEADYAEVPSVLKSARYTFDKWRYFEANVGGHGLSAMIDTERALDLAKAARVILDEAAMVGLGYSLDIDVAQRVRETDDRRSVHIKHDLQTIGREAPPK